jgi:hypothetical protein
MTILEEAAEITEGARPGAYAHPFLNHTRTAELWSVYLGVPITPEQVCFLNILQKISRSMHSITRDSLVDIAGFARNVEKVQDYRRERGG